MSSDPSPRISLRDIGKQLGLSHTTISRALKNDPHISTPVRQKIQAKAQEMGYTPDPLLSALAHYRQGKRGPHEQGSVIAWLNHWPKPEQSRKYGELRGYWDGSKACAAKFGYHLEELVMGDKISARRMSEILHSRGIKSLLIPPHPLLPHPPNWAGFNWQAFSVVRFGRSNFAPKVHLVTSDHVGNTWLAIRNMRELGYRRIGFVTGVGASARGTLFQAGFSIAQEDIDDKQRLPALILDEHAADHGQAQLAHWVKKSKPEAIFTDIAAMIGLLQASGIRVPEDIAVATTSVLDGNADAGISQNAHEIGRVAFLALLTLIHDNDRGIPRVHHEILVPGEWLNGKSLPPR